VTNPEDWLTTVGVDEETDAALRQRCFLAWEELSQGGTAAAYISWALSVAGVKSAFVDDTLPRGEGTVDVYIMGEAGPPDPALIEAVQEVVDDNRPITADALVFSPEVVTVPVTLGVTPRAGYDTTAMDTEIRRRLSVFFGDIEDATLPITPLGVGKDVVVAQIVGILDTARTTLIDIIPQLVVETATGEYLDMLARARQIFRGDEETDESLRIRVLAAHEIKRKGGTIPGMENGLAAIGYTVEVEEPYKGIVEKWSRFVVKVFLWDGVVADHKVFYQVVRLLKPAHTRALIESLLLPETWDDFELDEPPKPLDEGLLDGWLPTP